MKHNIKYVKPVPAETDEVKAFPWRVEVNWGGEWEPVHKAETKEEALRYARDYYDSSRVPRVRVLEVTIIDTWGNP